MASCSNDARVAVETIRAVIEAYGRGEIELEAPDETFNERGVYRFPGGKRYSLATVARFLGWVKPSDGQAKMASRVAFDAYRKVRGPRRHPSALPLTIWPVLKGTANFVSIR